MRVILLKSVHNLGQKGAIITAADGFARNYLLPRGLGKLATDEAVREIQEAEKRQLKIARKQSAGLHKLAQKISGRVIQFEAHTSKQNHLYAALSIREIAERISQSSGITVGEENVHLEKPIKTVGRHTAQLRGKDLVVSFIIEVIAKNERQPH